MENRKFNQIVLLVLVLAIVCVLFCAIVLLKSAVDKLPREAESGPGWFKCYCMDKHRGYIQKYADILKEQDKHGL